MANAWNKRKASAKHSKKPAPSVSTAPAKTDTTCKSARKMLPTKKLLASPAKTHFQRQLPALEDDENEVAVDDINANESGGSNSKIGEGEDGEDEEDKEDEEDEEDEEGEDEEDEDGTGVAQETIAPAQKRKKALKVADTGKSSCH